MTNAEEMQTLILDLRKRLEAVKAAGGPEKIEKQKKGGRLTARERIEKLLDPGSFVELEALVRHRCFDFGMEKREAPADAVITGYGTINGRVVCVFAQDFTVIGGSLGLAHAKKICDVMDLAAKIGAPVIGLCDSAGARVQEGVDALAGYGQIFYRNSIYSGVIPQIAALMGPCAGGAVYSPALQDFTIMVDKFSYAHITGPKVIKAVTGEDVTSETLGGATVHATKSGLCDLVAVNDEHCLQLIKELLSFLPSNNLEDPPIKPTSDPWDRRDPSLNEIVPVNPKKSYDVRDVIKRVVDEGYFFEIKENFARNIVVGFARLDGRSIGIVANQPKVLAGSLDVDSSDKGSRFIRFCDCFNIPLIQFVDVPGYLPGVQQEYLGIIRHGAKMLFAYSEATVPKITLVLRKAYGGSYLAMCSKDLGADFVFAYPTAEIAVMGPDGAVDVVFAKEIAAAKDPEALREKLIEDYKKKFANPYDAASKLYIDGVIEPQDTRPVLISALRILATKREDRPRKKHSNMPQ